MASTLPPIPPQPPPVPPKLPPTTTLPAQTKPYQAGYGIPHSKFKLIKTVVLAITVAVVILVCGGFINPRWFGWCLIGLGATVLLFAFSVFRKLFDNRPVLVFAVEGLYDHSDRKKSLLIPWEQMRKVTLWTLRVNGIPSTRTLILEVPDAGLESPKHKIDLDSLKGNPKVIAETVLQWANAARLSAPIHLSEGSGN